MIAEYLAGSLTLLAQAIHALLWPFLFFLVLAVVTKKRALWAYSRRVLPQSLLNLEIALINTIVFV
ncbi:MAG: hypothetical protein R3292_08920, partial [Alcanivorax sp.]|nr:hypothetical protein [Alcanivorax sp.]